MAGRDIVVDPGPLEPTEVVELAGIGAAGRDIVDDADWAAGAPARIPVVDPDGGAAPAAERIPVDESDPVDFEGTAAGAPCGVAAGGAGAVAGAAADTNVVPHCTQNFAPVWVSKPQVLHFMEDPPLALFRRTPRARSRGRSPPSRRAAIQPCVVFSSRRRCREPAPRQWTQVYMLGVGLGDALGIGPRPTGRATRFLRPDRGRSCGAPPLPHA
jgi:hypothetical protein